MSADKRFVDSNVFLYVLSGDAAKARVAEDIIRSGGMVSVQVLNEIVSVGRRKLRAEWSTVHDLLNAIAMQFRILPLSFAVHEFAVRLSQKNGLSIYDANIVAAADLAGCDTLFTEDLNNGQRIGSVAIRNPFMPV